MHGRARGGRPGRDLENRRPSAGAITTFYLANFGAIVCLAGGGRARAAQPIKKIKRRYNERLVGARGRRGRWTFMKDKQRGGRIKSVF